MLGRKVARAGSSVITGLTAGNDTSVVCKSGPRGHGLSGHRETPLCPISFTCPLIIYPLILLCFGMWDLDDILLLP